MKALGNAYQQAVGRLMRERRARLGYSQAHVARVIGVSQAAYCAWELGERAMSVEWLDAVARVFGVGAGELLPAEEWSA